MVVYPIGSVSIFINVNDKQNQILDEVLLNKIAKEFERYLSDKLKIKIENIEFDVRINWRRGCLIEIASLGIIITGAYKFIKDYDKIRENILLIFKDLKGAILMIKGKESKKSRERKITEEEIRIRGLCKTLQKLFCHCEPAKQSSFSWFKQGIAALRSQ